MYNKNPKIHISDRNYIDSSITSIKKKLNNYHKIALDCYPGTDYKALLEVLLNNFDDYEIILIDDYVKLNVEKTIEKEMTDDRVFGVMTKYDISNFYDLSSINIKSEKYIIYGFGASLVKNDVLIYLDLARWEIQKRYRAGMSNWNIDNPNMDNLKKFKIGFFFEWRMADRHKKTIMDQIDYFIDFTNTQNIKLIKADYIRLGLDYACNSPFRLVPFFDPAVWGGTWMEENCGLDNINQNYGWSFDGVPEENSIFLEYGDDYIELPAMTLVKYKPRKLLGDCTYHRFGDEFPIRFDFLDTINGENLSLQVHPRTEYIQEKFGMNYTQDESYYILDTKDGKDSVVYLGLKDNVKVSELISELEYANKTGTPFDDEKFINKVKVKKGDHLLIPAGTIHCSGKNTMILEISATPYIFTFKLWDWNRLGLDGKPRPTHITHGKSVIDETWTSTKVNEELFNNFEKISNIEERTGLHKTQFIESRRFNTSKAILHNTNGEVQMLNLVEGQQVVIKSPSSQFNDFLVNFAETFIIPAGVNEYVIEPVCGEVKYIKAYVRF